jgi:uridine kinase
MSADYASQDRGLAAAASTIVIGIRRRIRDREAGVPMILAIDGGSGCGKSTIAAMVAGTVDGVVVPSDDFFAADITDEGWDARDAAARVADVLDWQRLRQEALEPLLAGRAASWHPFDFDAGTRPDGSYAMASHVVTRHPSGIVVLEGAYSSAPQLANLVELSVLVDVPVEERHRRLVARDGDTFAAAWHARWDPAEAYYFSRVRPASTFDLVVANPDQRFPS